jgi:hypothetical protein
MPLQEQWSTQHPAFIVETFFKNGGSVVKLQQIFHKHFNFARQGEIPCHNTIELWVKTSERVLWH